MSKKNKNRKNKTNKATFHMTNYFPTSACNPHDDAIKDIKTKRRKKVNKYIHTYIHIYIIKPGVRFANIFLLSTNWVRRNLDM